MNPGSSLFHSFLAVPLTLSQSTVLPVIYKSKKMSPFIELTAKVSWLVVMVKQHILYNTDILN